MNSPTNTASGRSAIIALSGSTYTSDLDDRTFGRNAAGPDHELRQDGKAVHLIALMSCEMGKPTTLVINLMVLGVDYTTRTTTPVLLIETLPPRTCPSRDPS